MTSDLNEQPSPSLIMSFHLTQFMYKISTLYYKRLGQGYLMLLADTETPTTMNIQQDTKGETTSSFFVQSNYDCLIHQL